MLNIRKTAIMVAAVLLLAGCGEEDATSVVEETVETVNIPDVENPVDNNDGNDVGYFGKNLLDDIVETDGSREGTIPVEEDDIYVYVILESSIVNISENSGAVEKVFTNGENIFSFYHTPGMQGEMVIHKIESGKEFEKVDNNVAILNEIKNIILTGKYSLLKIDDTQYAITVGDTNQSTSYRINILNNVVSDVLVETMLGNTVQQEWHINIQYGLTDDDVKLLTPLF